MREKTAVFAGEEGTPGCEIGDLSLAGLQVTLRRGRRWLEFGRAFRGSR